MKISIVGKGNVGTHLFNEFTESTVDVNLIDSRTLSGLSTESDLIIITVTDTALADVAAKISHKLSGFKGLVAHTAGSVNIDILKPFFESYGVFYPLQTFSKGNKISNFKSIPIFIEANNKRNEKLLFDVAKLISDKIYPYTSEMREKLHLASVFVCNFVNALYSMGEEILIKEGIPFEVVIPLIEYTAEKIRTDSPNSCQTGPARRGDVEIMNKHLKLLSENKELAELYNKISAYIYKKYSK